MKVTKQADGLYTIEASQGKTITNPVGIHCKRAIDQTEAQTSNWTEVDEATGESDPNYVSDAQAIAELNTLLNE